MTINQNHLIHLEVLFISDIAVEPLTFAVEHLSLNVQEVVLLIHNVFVYLRDLGNNEVKQHDSNDELIKDPHEVDKVDNDFSR